MDILTKGLDVYSIEEYLARLNDEKAISQAKRRPLWQANRVFKFICGYGGKRTMQHNKEACEIWNRIVKKVYRKYMIFSTDDVDPTKLAEMNLYAIDLMKNEEELFE